jgi:hypothetical protein
MYYKPILLQYFISYTVIPFFNLVHKSSVSLVFFYMLQILLHYTLYI